MKTIFNFLDKNSPLFIFFMSCLSTLIIGAIDIATANIISVMPLFAIPVLFASWYGSKGTGIVLAVFNTIVWAIVQKINNTNPTDLEFTIMNGISFFLSYSILAVLITNFRYVYQEEIVAADTDNLTKLLNQRGFYAEFANELVRSIRYNHIFSLAYIDIDNFKTINDKLGHSVGDELLVETARCLKLSLRETDKISRIGGDEFVCLLPETEPETARNAFVKVKKLLQERMNKYNWQVGFSIGMVTFKTPPNDIKEAMRIADELMYSVKKSNKDDIAYQIWQGTILDRL